MGINGLLKGLQSYSKKRHITEFENQSLAVDASSWLHKSVYSIAEKHVEAAERSKTNHDPSCVNTSAQYMISRCTELLDHGAKISGIYLVMDGKRCPLKAQTNDEREQRRICNLKDARLYKKERKSEKSQDKYKACIKIHAAFADAVSQQIQSHFKRNHDHRVHILKSPYEADSQLVKLCVDGAVQAIVTEDSDVLVYCAACHVSVPILYKLERHGKNAGTCDVISMDWLLHPQIDHLSPPEQKDTSLDSILRSLCSREHVHRGKGVRLFVQACVLAGSDYSPSLLTGIGLVTAFKIVRDQSHKPCDERFHQVLSGLAKKQKGAIDMILYEQNLARSEAVFYFHPVLQIGNNQIVHLNPPSQRTQQSHPTNFQPCLDRFENDLWFLGRLDGRDTHDLRSPDVVTNVPSVPLTTIFVRTQKRKRHTKADSEGKQPTLNVVNPYSKSCKGSAMETESDQPIESINSYTQSRKVLAHMDSNSQPNPFANFSHKNTVHNTTENNIYNIYHQKGDVRFAKRNFSQIASKPVSKIIDYAKAKAAFLRPQQPQAKLKKASDLFAKATTTKRIVEDQQRFINVEEGVFHYTIPARVSHDGVNPDDSMENSLVVEVEEFQLLQPRALTSSGGCSSFCVPSTSQVITDYPQTSSTDAVGGDHNLCLVDDDYCQQFAHSRRVTLDTPQRNELDEFRATCQIQSNTNTSSVQGSPGESSVLSEIDEMENVCRPPFIPPGTPSVHSDGFGEVPSIRNATPFQAHRTLADKLSHRGKKYSPRQNGWRIKKHSPLQAGFELQRAKHTEGGSPLVRFGGRRGLDIRRVGGAKPTKLHRTINSFFSKSKPPDIMDDF